MRKDIGELLKTGRVTLVGEDDQQFPVQQFEFMGNAASAMCLFPYGFHANADIDAYSLMVEVNGEEEMLFAFPTSANDRIKNLKKGEVIIFNILQGSHTYYKEDGSIEHKTEKATFTIFKNGDIVEENEGLTRTSSNDGNYFVENENGNFGLNENGNFEVNGTVIDTTGKMTTANGATVDSDVETAAGVSVDGQ